MLKYLNKKFINSSLKTKLELYLLPLLIIYLIYYILINIQDNKTNGIKNSVNTKQFINKKFDASFLELFNKIEKIAKQLNMKVQSLNNKNNNIELKIYAKIKDLGKLIKNIENINNFTKISSISIYEKDEFGFYFIDFVIDLNNFHLKNIEEKKEIIIEKNENKIKKDLAPITLLNDKNDKYILKAIISDFVMINDRWIKKGENIDDFELIKINKNFVILQNHEKNLKLELINEEYLKNIY